VTYQLRTTWIEFFSSLSVKLKYIVKGVIKHSNRTPEFNSLK